MDHTSPWVNDTNAPLLTDLYELTMLQAYWQEEMFEEAVFSCFFRKLPPHRNFLLACGQDDCLRYLENLRFSDESLEFLARQKEFSDNFLQWLKDFRFTGDVYAMEEGTPFFPDEPMLEVIAPMPEAQLAETFILNQVHHQTVIASKTARVVMAAGDMAVVDFGLRRMHGTDAGVKAAKAFHIAGVKATSNVFAGFAYDVPITGTMAHSFIQAFDREMDAYRAFAKVYPETILLVDTYDTLEGVKKVIELAREMGEDFKVRGIRLDSGDLADLAKKSRRMLDDAGLKDVAVFASGSLDEYKIRDLHEQGAPISGLGVGTKMGVSSDKPYLDMVYKLTSYAGKGRLKTSTGKQTLPGQKQVFRMEEQGKSIKDVITVHGESHDGRPLLKKVMENGKRTGPSRLDLNRARDLARGEMDRLPAEIRELKSPETSYPVEISPRLQDLKDHVLREITTKDKPS